LQGRLDIKRFLTDKWAKETQYKLKKRLFAFEENRIAVQFWCVLLSPVRVDAAQPVTPPCSFLHRSQVRVL